MNKLYLKILFSIALILGGTTIALAQNQPDNTAKKTILEQLTQQFNNNYNANQLKIQTLAPAHNWFIRRKNSKGDVISLQRVSALGFPVYYHTFNNTTAAATTRTNAVQPGGELGLSLSGSSSFLNGRLAIWDEGSVYAAHQEFSGKTITLKDAATATSLHSTHVAGTMIAKGVYAPAKGMSFNSSTLLSYDFDNDITEMSAAASSLLLSNHSYGVIAGWEQNDDGTWNWYGLPGDTEDYKFGFYDTDAQNMDKIAYNAPSYLIVVAAGNNRVYTGPAVGTTYYGYKSRTDQTIVSKGPRPAGISSNNGYDILPTFANAKNILTVGAIQQQPSGPASRQSVAISNFSSLGPTDDGRIKPDICGDGDNVLSTSNSGTSAYATLSGTSMATPNVTGSLQLLQEYYAQKHNGSFMRSATLKGLACHTAFDAGNVGPDYTYGWGVLDTRKAAQAITDQNTKSLINENTLQQGQTYTIKAIASGTGALIATIAWTDPQGTPSTEGTINDRTAKLVNDLDIRVSDGTSTFLPWVLSYSNPSAAATKGDNSRDNVEQVYVDGAVPGRTYTILVSHKGTLQSGSQPYSLIVTGGGGTTYCTSAPTSSADSRINNVTFSNINNTPTAGCTTYSDYTALTTQLEIGRTYPISLTLGTCGGNFNKIAKVFIDWNADGVFNTTDELVATSGVITGTGTFTANVTVPSTATSGNSSLMRVVLQETSTASAVTACGSYGKGETQDYRVQFTAPAIDAGATAISNSAANGNCAGTNNITVRLKNYGTSAISNVPVTVTVTSANNTVVTLNETYTGTLAAGTEDNFILSGTFNAQAGAAYTLSATTKLSGDAVTGNDQTLANITIGAAPAATNLTANYCNDTNRYLLNGTGDGTLLWYSAATGGAPLTYGQNAFTTTAPTNNTYYAGVNDLNAYVGPATKSVFSGGGYNQFGPNVTVFTRVPVIIQSARLYVGNSGHVTFTVSNANGQVVSSSTLALTATRTTPGSGAQSDDAADQGQVYNLNLQLPAAGTYTISTSFSDDATLFRSNSGVSGYPYKIGDVFSIVSNTATTTSTTDTAAYKSFYYYFYNMHVISAGCPSATRQSVIVTTPVIIQNGTTLSSNFAANNQWYLNGTAITAATGQTYLPTQSGNYQLQNVLTTGCTTISPVYTYIKSDAVLNTPNDISLSVFPVPANTNLNVAFIAPAASDLNMALISTAGRIVYTNKSTVPAGNYSTAVNVSAMPPGTYILRLRLGQKQYATKLIIDR
ncbi:S8 family serine peptidase [Mucilaginibacter robiniae]|uniref:S8 family serine peptidase n=1 Tax=Mucilaginibacter robiniae TaxID=2728022 RepID=A0A7L5DWS1_9SPHI|nr:S8 family serine peptidase [Mucilaginibacter robiniae]QJD95540.1 S8 family serine peptidase [Mucilaginibacter robiniae]